MICLNYLLNFEKNKIKTTIMIFLIITNFICLSSTYSNNDLTIMLEKSNQRQEDSLLAFSEDEISFNAVKEIIMNLPSLSVNLGKGEDNIFTNWDYSLFSGAPQLPVKNYRILLPPNIIQSSISIDIIEEEIVHLANNFDFSLSPFEIALLGDGVVVSNDNYENDLFSEDDMWPKQIIRSVKLNQLREAKILEFSFYPLQYDSETNTIHKHDNVKISIKWKTTQKTSLDPLTWGFLKEFQESLDNFDEISYMYEPKLAILPDTSYIVITTNDIVGNSSNLDDFIRYKQALGFDAKIITEDDFGVVEGKARALNIRSWLQSHYINDNIEYVLLIGDPNPDDELSPTDPYGDIPMLMCWPRSGYDTYNCSPTDYFYSDLTGNWNTDGDDFYGEHMQDTGVDFYPEVYVGRIPVYDEDYVTLDEILDNTINHHINAGAEKSNILEPIAISNYYNEEGDGTRARTDGLDLPEEVYTNILSSLGMTDTVLYEQAGIDPVDPSAFHYSLALDNSNFISFR